VHVDGWVLTFTLALVVAAALLAGLVPAISSTGKELLSGLRDSSRTVGGSASRARLRKTMLTAEIALTAVLLISAGLPRGRSIRRRLGAQRRCLWPSQCWPA
jgi:hypothetical protein